MSDPLGIMPLARELGEKLGGDPWCEPIPTLERVTIAPVSLSKDAWPAEVWAEIERIQNMPDPFEQEL